MGDKHEKVTERLACEVESGHTTGGSEGTLKPYPEGGTAGVARKRDPNKSGYLNFDPSGMYTINWRKLDQE